MLLIESHGEARPRLYRDDRGLKIEVLMMAIHHWDLAQGGCMHVLYPLIHLQGLVHAHHAASSGLMSAVEMTAKGRSFHVAAWLSSSPSPGRLCSSSWRC